MNELLWIVKYILDDFVFLNCTRSPHSLEISTCFPIAAINRACGNTVAAISARASVGVSIRAIIRSRLWGCIFGFCLGIFSLVVSSECGSWVWTTFSWVCRMFTVNILSQTPSSFSDWRWTLYVGIVQYIHAKYWMQRVLYFLPFLLFLGQRICQWSSDVSCRCSFLFGSFQTMFEIKYLC